MTVSDHASSASPSSAPVANAQNTEQQQQQQQQQQPGALKAAGSSDSSSSNANASSIDTFEQFRAQSKETTNRLFAQVSDVTGVQEERLLIRAFNETKRLAYTSLSDRFSVNRAVEWLIDRGIQGGSAGLGQPGDAIDPSLKLPDLSSFPTQSDLSSSVAQPSSMPPAVALTRSEASTASPGGDLRQPPNSPSAHRPAAPGAAVPVLGPDQGIKPLIDLTEGKEKEDLELQKAIKLSLQEQTPNFGGGVGTFSQEDQDVSRALEASLLESSNSKRKRGDTWIDPQNPHERERQGTRPVGLKNVGSTCWFSAVIQSLFYLPAFRNLVLSYPPSQQKHTNSILPPMESTSMVPESTTLEAGGTGNRDKKVVEFMLELRKLFALMLATHRKYVDPSKAIEMLKGSIGTQTANNQEDVSEFTHVIFDWLEEAFEKKRVADAATEKDNIMDDGENSENANPNLGAADQVPPSMAPGPLPSSNPAESRTTAGYPAINPMKEFFYGNLVVEGRRNNGEQFSRTEEFGQYPVQVNGYSDIHESLEISTAHETIVSSLQSDSSQERWFRTLPPVLFLSLSRFAFNQERGLAEKIHSRLDFPEQIYLDRYMEENKELIRAKREEVRGLKEKRSNLRKKLDQFTQFGSGEVKMPLKTILESMLEFAASGSPDFAMSQPKESHGSSSSSSAGIPSGFPSGMASNLMHVDSPCHSPKMTPASSLVNINEAAGNSATKDAAEDTPMDVEDDAQMMPPPAAVEVAPQPTTSDTNVERAGVTVPPPFPKHISNEEFQVLKDCLTRWQGEVSCDMSSLESSIQEIDGRIAAMYTDASLMARGFRLHAVMVHEGGTDSGHYWAYVFDHKRKVWIKCNDNTVNEATWEELEKESLGGRSNTSAYSLVYINGSKPEKILLDTAAQQKENEESMEQGALESLLQSLPNDLAEYVSEDNKAFAEERRKWDEDQESKKKEEAMITVENRTGASSDVMVVEEKLTYVNTHASLSLDTMRRLMSNVEENTAGITTQILAERVIAEARRHFYTRSEQSGLPLMAGTTTTQTPPALTDSTPIKLESFVIYLLRNQVPATVIQLALLEQFSLPSLENEGRVASTMKKHCEDLLKQSQQSGQAAVSDLKLWHQAYHMFRVSAACLVDGVDRFLEQKFEESLELFSIAYNISRRISERPPEGSMKTLKPSPIVRYTSLALFEVHTSTMKQFKLGGRLDEAKEHIRCLLCPALFLLDDWLKTSNGAQDSCSSLVGQTVEKVRSEWCSLLGEADTMAPGANDALSEMLTLLLETPAPKAELGDGSRLPKNRDHIDQQVDLKLAESYRQAIKSMEDRNATGGNVKW